MNIDTMSLDDINHTTNKEKKQILLDSYNEYFNYFKNIGVDKNIIDRYYGKTISQVEQHIYQDIENESVKYYQNCSYVKARTDKTCSFCGDKIPKKHKYYRYHPFIVKNSNELLVLKKGDLTICSSCSSLIPNNYEQLENIKENLEIHNNITTYDRNFYDINYDSLKETVGEELEFKNWTKKRKRKTTFVESL